MGSADSEQRAAAATGHPEQPCRLFDDPALFRLVEQRLLPALVAARQRHRCLRLWSAACGDGSEPYTLALLASALLAEHHGWQLTVLGSEPDPRWVPSAQRLSSDDRLPPPQALRQAGLQRAIGSAWTVAAAVRRLVEFVPIDLTRDVVPSLLNGTVAIDLIVCRGLLPTQSVATAADVFGKLCRALAPGGYLLIDRAPALSLPEPGLCDEAVGDHRLVQRTDGDPVVAADPPAPSGAEPLTVHARALVAYRQGRFALARALLHGSARTAAQPATSLALLARIEAVQGRIDEARAWCELAVAADELDPAHHCLRACLLQEQGAFGEAMQGYQRALYLDPGYMLAHFGLGRLARRLGRLGEAERHYGNAGALARMLDPDVPLPHADGLTAGRFAAIVAALAGAQRADAGPH